MAIEQADVVIIGSGPAGYVCAIRAAQMGRQVPVIEREYIGGVCLNVGCIPSKALIHAGTMVERIAHAEEMGISVKGVDIDVKKLIDWKGTVVKKLTGGVGQLLKANGCKVVSGEAKFINAHTLEVKSATGTTQMAFKDCVIATGSRPSRIPGWDVDQKQIVDSTGALAPAKLPDTLLCVGGGYIGLELGTFYAKMGVKVTVVEAMPGLLSGVDPDLTRVVEKGLKKRGVMLYLSTKVKANRKTKNTVEVDFEGADGKTFTGNFDQVLITVGRKPNTDSLGLESANIKVDAQGFISVNEKRQTTIPHIWAIGDVAGQPLLAHKGSKEGLVCAEALGGKDVAFDVAAIPAVIFTDPEIATVGMTEAQARAEGVDVMIGNFPFVANGRALSVNETDGFVKLVGDRASGRLLGAHIVGPEASNLIAEAALALEMGARVEDLALTIHAHPTLPETLMEAAEAALGHAVHIYQRKAPVSSAGAGAGASAHA
ncbi:MAG TPA: dihydrolipoyl dehydrogenase [Bdellovibrionota bacterium]|nr:dihydrolipoyl dehydrogenase [Bdellovibrionota bacterium]